MTTPELLGIGQAVPQKNFGPLTQTDLVRYAGASGDFNPLHHDDSFARGAGFPGVFSMGMLQAGFLANYATDWFGLTCIRRFAVQFRGQVWVGDVLTCSGTVQEVDRTTNLIRVRVALECARQDGEVVVTGEAEFHPDAA